MSSLNQYDLSGLSAGSYEEFDLLSKLNQRFGMMRSGLAEYVAENIENRDLSVISPKLIQKTAEMYYKTFFGDCYPLLKKGIRVSSLLQYIGMWMGCCLYSSAVQELVSPGLVKEMIPALNKVCEKNSGSSNGFWNNHRYMIRSKFKAVLPVSPDVLGLLKCAWCMEAYSRMHNPVYNVDDVMESCRKGLNAIDRLCSDFGFSVSVCNKWMRMTTGEILMADPDKDIMFEEIAYGIVVNGGNTTYTKKIVDINGSIMRTFDKWEGRYLVSENEEYDGGFHPRRPQSVEVLRKLRKENWIEAGKNANDPKSFLCRLYSKNVCIQQRRFVRMIEDDRKLFSDGDSYGDWIYDYGGEDPYVERGINIDADSFMIYGPGNQTPSRKPGALPEMKSAIGCWMVQHPDYNPAYWQRKANDAYRVYAGSSLDEDGQVVFHYLSQRDAVELEWTELFSEDAEIFVKESPVFNLWSKGPDSVKEM